MKHFSNLRVWILLIILALLPGWAWADSSVLDMEAEGNTVYVEWQSTEDAMLTVEIIEDGQSEPYAIKKAMVSGEEGDGEEKFIFTSLPTYFSIEAYFSPVSSGTGGGEAGNVYVEELYTEPVQKLIQSDGSEYAAQYGDHYLELFIGENGEKSFGVLMEEYTVLRTSELAGDVTIVQTDTDNNAIPEEITITTTNASQDAAWLDELTQLASGNPAYLCIVDDQNRTLLDYRTLDDNEMPNEDSIVQFYMMYLDSATAVPGGLRLAATNEPMRRQRDVMNDIASTLESLLDKFRVFRFNTSWNLKDQKKSDKDYSVNFDLKGDISIHSILTSARRIEIDNDFNFKKIDLDGATVDTKFPIFFVNIPLKLLGGGVELDFRLNFSGGQHVKAAMSGNMKHVFSLKGQSGGTRIDHIQFDPVGKANSSSPQKLTLTMGPELDLKARAGIAELILAGFAYTTVDLVQGSLGNEVMWHACGMDCVEGFPQNRQQLNIKLLVNYLIGDWVLRDDILGETQPQKGKEFYHSEKFNKSGEGLCPYKGYKTNIKLLDAKGRPVQIDGCAYTPVRPEMMEKASSGAEGVLYIPASNTPVTVQVTYTTEGGVQRTMSQQIIKSAQESTVTFQIEDEYWLIYDNDGVEEVRNMPDPVSCSQDDIFPITEQIPTYSGFTFAGWSFKPQADLTRQVDYRPGDPFWMTDELFDESNTVTLYPVWEGISYLIYTTEKGDEGKVTNMPPPILFNQPFILSYIPERGEHDYFVGWMDDKNTLPNLPMMPNPYYPESGTLTAKFVNTDFAYPTVTFNEGNHVDVTKVMNMPKPVQTTIGVPFKLPAEIPFMIDLDFWSVDVPQFFVGWSLFENSKIPTFFPGMDFVALTDTTLYAVWVDRPDFYLLSYNANGGSGEPWTGFNSKKISTTVPTRPGHEFKGWVKKDDLKDDLTPKGNAVIYQPGDPNPFYEEIEEDGEVVRKYRSGTLYAVWKASNDVYTVYFDANQGTDAPDGVTGRKGSAVMIPTQLPKPPANQPDAKFAGWGDKAVNPGSIYQPGGSYTGTKNVTLYAQWKTDEFTVYYDANGGNPDSAPEKQTFAVSEPNKILRNGRPVRDGYRFEGWAVDANAQYAQYQPGSLYEGEQSIVLYAVWTVNKLKTGVITYDANGGEHAPEEQYTPFGQKTTISEQIPMRENHIFMGWANDPQAEKANYQPGEEYLFAGDVTFYAVWKLDEAEALTIVYNANGGELDLVPAEQIFDADEPDKLISSEKPVRTGYRFEGWASDPDAQETQYQPGSRYDGKQSIVLYAVWSAHVGCVITYDANGGMNAPEPQLVSRGENVHLSMDVPVRENHIFMGWASAPDAAADEYQPGDDYSCLGDVTLYAVWNREAYKIYTVSYDANGGDEDSVPADESAFKGEMITLSEHIPTRSNHLFKGWALDPDAQTANYQPGTWFVSESDITLYAVWQIEPSSMFTVTYHANGGTGAPEKQSGIVGTPVTLSEEIPVKNHCTFMGWAMSPTAYAADFAAGQLCLVNGDIMLYAVWQPDPSSTFTVTYHANGGVEASVPAAQTVLMGESVCVPNQKPVRDKHVFMGWSVSNTAKTVQFDMGETFICTRNLDLYAVWTEDYAQMYTVSYNANGGTGAPGAQIAFNDQKIQLTEQKPKWEGRVFLGWATDPAAEAAEFQPGGVFPADAKQPPYASTVLYAVWEDDPNKIYTVTYDANGGVGAPESQSEIKTEKVILSAEIPTWKDYLFLGWATDPSATAAAYQPGEAFPAADAPYADATLYAVWDKTSGYYGVTYDANGGQGAPEPQYALRGTAIKLSEKQPQLNAHVFLGWSTEQAAATPSYQPGAEFIGNADTTLYAVWEDDFTKTYTVIYDANGGDAGSVPQPRSALVGDSILVSSQKPVKQGSAFLGWAMNPDASDAEYQPNDSFAYAASGVVTLYAVWEDDPDKIYIVTFDANGSDAEVPASQTEKKGKQLQLSQMQPLDKKWRFMGWGLQSDSTLPVYQPGDLFPDGTDSGLYKNTTLYAIWDKDEDGLYTVTYHANGGTGAPYAQSAFVGSGILLSDEKPVRLGYDFQGWALSADAEEALYAPSDMFPGSSDIALYKDTTLYAVWKKDSDSLYTVTYDANGGTGTFAEQSALIGSTVQLHAHKPALNGNVFLGWALVQDAEQAIFQPGELCSFTQDIVLYAVWEPQCYTISYAANGGKGAPEPQSAPVNTAITLHDASHNPTRKNYSFQGWATDPNAEAAQYLPGGGYTGSEDVTLYAVWEAEQGKTYTVTYHANGGDPDTVPQPQTAVEDEPIAISLERPVHAKYTFGGWMRSKDGSVADFQPGHYYNEYKSMDLWALWTTQMRTILFDDNGGTDGPGSQSFQGETVTIVPAIPVKPGYRFEGWALSAEIPQTVCAVPGEVFAWPLGNTDVQLTLYAVWSDEFEPLPDLPDTGDSSAPMLWLALALLSGGGILLMRVRRKHLKD